MNEQSLTSKLQYKLPRMQLCLVHEDRKPKDLHVVRTPIEAADFLEPLKYHSEEHFITLHLNAKHEIIGMHEVSHGTLSSTLVHPREVFKAALLANSHAILVCHNHPSGSSLTPSAEDLETTRQLLSAGEFLGITLLDHLIVGPLHEPYSLRENHAHLWPKAS